MCSAQLSVLYNNVMVFLYDGLFAKIETVYRASVSYHVLSYGLQHYCTSSNADFTTAEGILFDGTLSHRNPLELLCYLGACRCGAAAMMTGKSLHTQLIYCPYRGVGP